MPTLAYARVAPTLYRVCGILFLQRFFLALLACYLSRDTTLMRDLFCNEEGGDHYDTTRFLWLGSHERCVQLMELVQ
jgi:hypothetical protein